MVCSKIDGTTTSALKLTLVQVRSVTDDDIGLKVLHEPPTTADQIVECVHTPFALF
jgi:hypothetical protein